MSPKMIYAAVGALFAAVAVNAQAAPNWAYVSSLCDQIENIADHRPSLLCHPANLKSSHLRSADLHTRPTRRFTDPHCL